MNNFQFQAVIKLCLDLMDHKTITSKIPSIGIKNLLEDDPYNLVQLSIIFKPKVDLALECISSYAGSIDNTRLDEDLGGDLGGGVKDHCTILYYLLSGKNMNFTGNFPTVESIQAHIQDYKEHLSLVESTVHFSRLVESLETNLKELITLGLDFPEMFSTKRLQHKEFSERSLYKNVKQLPDIKDAITDFLGYYRELHYDGKLDLDLDYFPNHLRKYVNSN